MWLVADNDNRLRLRFDFGEPTFKVFGTNREFVRKAMVADEMSVAVNFAFRAASALRAIVLGARKLDTLFARVLHHRLRQRMLRMNVNRGGDAEQLRFQSGVDWRHARHSWLAFGDCAGFVRSD